MKPPTKFSERIRSANQPPNVAIPKVAAQNDRRNYKNISIYITELPPTPAKFRDKYHRTKVPTTRPAVRSKLAPNVNNKYSLFTSRGISAQAEIVRRRQPITNHVVDKRPQSNQLSAIPTIYVDPRPHTLDFDSSFTSQTQNSFRNPSNYSVPSRARDQYVTALEEALEDMEAATLDQDFKDELCVIEQLFRVLSEAERTAALYALLQQTTPVQIRFFIHVLQQMGKSHPTYQNTELPLLLPYNAGSRNWASMVNKPMVPTINAAGTTSQTDLVTKATAMKLSTLSTVNNRFALDDVHKYRRARSNDGHGSSNQGLLSPGLPGGNIPGANVVMINEHGQILSRDQVLALQVQQQNSGFAGSRS
jgi:hypothetical protein